MALEKQVSKTFSRFNRRLVNLRNASEARERAIKQLAESLGVEIDLTRMPTPEEVSKQEEEENAAQRLREDETVMALLRESDQDDAR